jgi:hypothetical protein
LHQKEVSFCEPELSFAEFICLFGHSTLSIYVGKSLVSSFFGFDFVKRSFMACNRSSKTDNYFAKALLKTSL